MEVLPSCRIPRKRVFPPCLEALSFGTIPTTFCRCRELPPCSCVWLRTCRPRKEEGKTMQNPPKNPIRDAVEAVGRDRAAQIEGARPGLPSLFTCPECGGTLW